MKFISDIVKAATSDLVSSQNEAWISLVCDGYNETTRVYLCAVEKELKKRINSSTLIQKKKPLNFSSALSQWENVSTEDDKRVVDAIAEEITSYLSKNMQTVDFGIIAQHIKSKFKHDIFCDDIVIALAKLMSKRRITRNGTCYKWVK